jgi:hypothetical protein
VPEESVDAKLRAGALLSKQSFWCTVRAYFCSQEQVTNTPNPASSSCLPRCLTRTIKSLSLLSTYVGELPFLLLSLIQLICFNLDSAIFLLGIVNLEMPMIHFLTLNISNLTELTEK